MKTTTVDVDQIKNTISQHLDFLSENYNVDKIGVFGSITRGDNSDKSDVDMLVELSEPISLFKFIELEEFLSKVLGKKVDLVTEKALKSAIKDEILRETVYV